MTDATPSIIDREATLRMGTVIDAINKAYEAVDHQGTSDDANAMGAAFYEALTQLYYTGKSTDGTELLRDAAKHEDWDDDGCCAGWVREYLPEMSRYGTSL